jgi:hypothetical protein
VLYADAPGFHPGVGLYDGANLIDVGDSAAPVVIDWNNDGKKDLVVGAAAGGGDVRLYLNQNTDDDPVFNGYSMIESNGVPIDVTSGGGG